MSHVMDIQNRQGDRQLRSPTVWAWLRRVLRPQDRNVEVQVGRRDPLAVMAAASLVAAASCDAGDSGGAAVRLPAVGAPASSGVILPFPIHGEALLVKLAEALRNRFADRGPEWDPLLVQMSRGPRSRLSIDRRAYIEFHQDCCKYRAVIEAAHGTRVILETADFDALVDFVLPYIVGRLAQPAALEAAS